jgi:hypothetical protein
VIELLQNYELNQLSQRVHPQKGVRFTPYTYVNLESDNVLYAQDLDDIDYSEYVWGYYDGRGNDIIFTIT